MHMKKNIISESSGREGNSYYNKHRRADPENCDEDENDSDDHPRAGPLIRHLWLHMYMGVLDWLLRLHLRFSLLVCVHGLCLYM